MKKLYSIVAAMSLMAAFVSCEKDDEDVKNDAQPSYYIEYTAGYEIGIQGFDGLTISSRDLGFSFDLTPDNTSFVQKINLSDLEFESYKGYFASFNDFNVVLKGQCPEVQSSEDFTCRVVGRIMKVNPDGKEEELFYTDYDYESFISQGEEESDCMRVASDVFQGVYVIKNAEGTIIDFDITNDYE